MPVFKYHPKGESRTLVDYNKVMDDIELGDTLICLPIALLHIIRKFLVDRGMWSTSYIVGLPTDAGYYCPNTTEIEPIHSMIAEFLERTVTVNCQDLLNAITDIASAIRSSACCAPGQNVPIVDDGEGGFYYGSEAPLDKPDTFGEGEEFETEQAFLDHLCTAANAIVSGIILSLNNWSVLSLALLIAGSIAVAIFVANPPIGILLALATAGFVFGTMHTISNYIADNREEWVCAIYSAASYSDTLAAIDALVTTMIGDLNLEAFEDDLTELFHSMITTDVVNQAYSAIGLPDPIDPVSCEACGVEACPGTITNSLGVLIEGTLDDYGTVYMRSSCPGSFQRLDVKWLTCPVDIIFNDIQSDAVGGTRSYQIYRDQTLIYNSSTAYPPTATRYTGVTRIVLGDHTCATAQTIYTHFQILPNTYA